MASVFVFLVESRARYGANLSVAVIIMLANALHIEKRNCPNATRAASLECETNSAAISSRNRAPRSSATSRAGCEKTWSLTCITECTLQEKTQIRNANETIALTARRSQSPDSSGR
jgi:hypothetical protein